MSDSIRNIIGRCDDPYVFFMPRQQVIVHDSLGCYRLSQSDEYLFDPFQLWTDVSAHAVVSDSLSSALCKVGADH